jgi:hypothetical protein
MPWRQGSSWRQRLESARPAPGVNQSPASHVPTDSGGQLVCVQIVADDQAEGQPPQAPSASLRAKPGALRVTGFPRALPDAGGRDGRAEHAYTDARVRSDLSWGSLEAALDLVELGSTCTVGWTDRRTGNRVLPLVLSESQRSVARAMSDASRSCGASLRAFVSWRPGRGYGQVLRMVAQLHCGTRACERCQARMRESAASRMAIKARLFLSLSVPPYMFNVRESWELCHVIVRQFIAIIRREAYYRNRPITGRRACDRSRMRARRSLARSRLRGGGKFEYSWAKEPQGGGMPHLHLLTAFSWVDFAWIRSVWASVWGAQDADIDGRVVKSIRGACWYLTAYVAKQKTSLDILAIIKRKRMWATTKRKEPSVRIPWMQDVRVSEGAARWVVDQRDEQPMGAGWLLESGADDRYAIFSQSSNFEGVFSTLIETSSEGTDPRGQDDMNDSKSYESWNHFESKSEHNVFGVELSRLMQGLTGFDLPF